MSHVNKISQKLNMYDTKFEDTKYMGTKVTIDCP